MISRRIALARWSVSIALALVVPVNASLQSPARDQVPARPVPSGTAVLGGVVTSDDANARPIRRVIVTLSGTAGATQTVTDDAGRFAFGDLPAGRYTLTAEKPAYLKTFYGSRAVARGPGTSIAMADGQRMTNVTIRLTRGAVIAGQVLDENGTPISSAQVTVLQVVSAQRRASADRSAGRECLGDDG